MKGSLLYEYQFVTRFASINIAPEEFSLYTEDQANTATAQLFGGWAEAITGFLATYDDGTWQVVSHNVAIYGSKLIVSFLLRHPVTSPKAHQYH